MRRCDAADPLLPYYMDFSLINSDLVLGGLGGSGSSGSSYLPHFIILFHPTMLLLRLLLLLLHVLHVLHVQVVYLSKVRVVGPRLDI